MTPTRVGEMEQTMFRHFVMGQKLRTIFHPESIPPEVRQLLPAYQHVFQHDIRGTLLSDSLAFDETFQKLPEDVTWSVSDLAPLAIGHYGMLRSWILEQEAVAGHAIPRHVFFRQGIKRLGQTFQTAEISFSDSHIIFRKRSSAVADPDSDWSAGEIDTIFSHTQQLEDTATTRTFMVVKEYVPLSSVEASHDNFRLSPAAGRLFHLRFRSQPVLLHVDDIMCHAALCCFEVSNITDCVHVLPLNKV